MKGNVKGFHCTLYREDTRAVSSSEFPRSEVKKQDIEGKQWKFMSVLLFYDTQANWECQSRSDSISTFLTWADGGEGGCGVSDGRSSLHYCFISYNFKWAGEVSPFSSSPFCVMSHSTNKTKIERLPRTFFVVWNQQTDGKRPFKICVVKSSSTQWAFHKSCILRFPRPTRKKSSWNRRNSMQYFIFRKSEKWKCRAG